MKKNEKQEINLKKFGKTLNKLIKEEKVSFKFYNDTLLKLDVIQLVYDKKEEILELEFRNVIKEQVQELNRLIKDNNQGKYNGQKD